jgi:uncharacterized protein involved in response to NO
VILNKAMAVSIWAAPLTVVGIEMDLPSFMAGIFLALPAYYFGREIWKEQGRVSFWMGMGMALFAAVIVAAEPGLIPLDVSPQIKMALVSLCITLIVARAERQGKEWSKTDD